MTDKPAEAAPKTPVEKDIPPEAGKRASINKNGEVHGSGAGAGGGNPGEGYDDGTSGE